MQRLFLLALFFAMAPAHAAVLQLCAPSDSGARAAGGDTAVAAVSAVGARGERISVVAADGAEPGCRTLALHVPVEKVLAVHPLGKGVAPGLDEIMLQGPERDGRFIIGSATLGAEKPPAGPQPMPLQSNLLSGLTVRSFGVEERVKAHLENGRLHLQCAAGSKPAGILLVGAWYLPRAQASLQWSASGSGRYDVQLADAALAAKETALSLGSMAAGRASLALPNGGFNPAQWRSLSIACPRHAAELTIDDLRLVPQGRGGEQSGSRFTWIWDAAVWRDAPHTLFALAQTHGLSTLYISVPIEGGEVINSQQLAAFIAEATRRGIAVWSVDGDPQMVLPAEHAVTAGRVRAYTRFNAQVAPASRLAGMQFDVEHYLLPGYESAARDLDRGYVELVRTLHKAAAGIPLEFVVPFWWSDKTELLQALGRHASSLAIMNYRTDPAQLQRLAVPFLDWGVVYNRKVRIAMEMGPIEAERQRRYRKAARGQLWTLTLARTPLLLLLDDAHANPHGAAYRLQDERLIDGSATTFHAAPQRLLQLLPHLEDVFSAWPSFGGAGIHELK